MKYNLPTVAKGYLLGIGLLNFHHGLSALGLTETLVTAPPQLGLGWWHVLFFLGYGLLPLTVVFVNNERICVLLTVLFLTGLLTAAFGVFTMTLNGFLIFVLDAVGAILALALAVEHAAVKVAAERLNLERSQF